MSSNHNSHSSHSKRNVDIVVISDVHLGTAACRATQLLAYLKSINPGKLVLNGDIIDMQQFDQRYWPASHTKVVRRILKFTTIGIPVFYVTGNHEQALRPYSSMLFDFGLLHLVDRLEDLRVTVQLEYHPAHARLQQVDDQLHPFHARDGDYFRRIGLTRQAGEEFISFHAGKADIEQNDIDGLAGDLLVELGGITGLVDSAYERFFFQEGAQPLADEHFVFEQQDVYLFHAVFDRVLPPHPAQTQDKYKAERGILQSGFPDQLGEGKGLFGPYSGQRLNPVLFFEIPLSIRGEECKM